MLSTLFQQVSSLKYVPACVARKPNMSSLKYGFVTFPTISEKENAIIQFTGYELNNKIMKVEEITDYKYRVRVPEKLVVYAVGEVKRTREGKKNNLWKVSNSRMEDPSLKSTRMMMDRDRNSKSQQRRRRNKKTYSPTSSTSSSFMFGSDRSDGDQYSYKSKKRKRKDNRRNRRSTNRSLDDYAF
jgi:RNA recognition motif-containing protein